MGRCASVLCRYERFVGFNGKALPNVVLQNKNGPYDFQVRADCLLTAC